MRGHHPMKGAGARSAVVMEGLRIEPGSQIECSTRDGWDGSGRTVEKVCCSMPCCGRAGVENTFTLSRICRRSPDGLMCRDVASSIAAV